MTAKKKKVTKHKVKEASWRIRTLATPKYFTPKVTEPYEFKNVIHPSTLNGKRPERVLSAAYPYERILLDTREKFADVLTDRSKKYIELVLSNTVNTIYNKLVKRPQCTGAPLPVLAKPPEWTPTTWRKHKERIESLAKPKKDFLATKTIQKRKHKDLESLMPRIRVLAKPPSWRIYTRLSKDPMYKDPTKLVNRKALNYVPTERMLAIARPKKTDDMSFEGLMHQMIWDKFIKRTDHLYQRLIIREKLGLVR